MSWRCHECTTINHDWNPECVYCKFRLRKPNPPKRPEANNEGTDSTIERNKI